MIPIHDPEAVSTSMIQSSSIVMLIGVKAEDSGVFEAFNSDLQEKAIRSESNRIVLYGGHKIVDPRLVNGYHRSHFEALHAISLCRCIIFLRSANRELRKFSSKKLLSSKWTINATLIFRCNINSLIIDRTCLIFCTWDKLGLPLFMVNSSVSNLSHESSVSWVSKRIIKYLKSHHKSSAIWYESMSNKL